ncbi:MAG: hypothetical protein IPN68_04250 [Bacteroidetes bacterium]|nr:hypothetical protein [Bacteroidota bacterium]
MERRHAVKLLTILSAGLYAGSTGRGSSLFSSYSPVRAVTKGPGFHWFGYYDKLQFDPSNRYLLGMQVNFEHRSPEANDEIRIGMVDLQDNDRWIDLGSSKSWGWQQGCMLQWIPGSKDEIIWNDREKDHFVSRILNIKNGKMRTLPEAVYALSPDGSWAIGTSFSRIQNLRPGYGYPGINDPFENKKAPSEIGLYKVDLKKSESIMLFSLKDLSSIPYNDTSVQDNYHWFNHLLVNTDGTRFTFLHRWRHERSDRQTMAVGGFTTRMFTASPDGTDLFCIDPSGSTSHFIWEDPSHINAFTKPEENSWGFYILEDKTGRYTQFGKEKMPVNGHQTYLPWGNGKEWLLCDNYASGSDRNQIPYLFHIPSDRRIDIGSFPLPAEYKGEWRCDLHPRFSPDGKMVCIDSPHGGNGRQLYIIDISDIRKKMV